MATLTNGRMTVTVPDEAVDDYLKQGWRRPAGNQPAPAPKKRTRRRASSAAAAKTKTTKGASDDAHAVRAAGHQATPKADS